MLGGSAFSTKPWQRRHDQDHDSGSVRLEERGAAKTTRPAEGGTVPASRYQGNRWLYVQALQDSGHLQIHRQSPHCLNQTQESLWKYYKGSK